MYIFYRNMVASSSTSVPSEDLELPVIPVRHRN